MWISGSEEFVIVMSPYIHVSDFSVFAITHVRARARVRHDGVILFAWIFVFMGIEGRPFKGDTLSNCIVKALMRGAWGKIADAKIHIFIECKQSVKIKCKFILTLSFTLFFTDSLRFSSLLIVYSTFN